MLLCLLLNDILSDVCCTYQYVLVCTSHASPPVLHIVWLYTQIVYLPFGSYMEDRVCWELRRGGDDRLTSSVAMGLERDLGKGPGGEGGLELQSSSTRLSFTGYWLVDSAPSMLSACTMSAQSLFSLFSVSALSRLILWSVLSSPLRLLFSFRQLQEDYSGVHLLSFLLSSVCRTSLTLFKNPLPNIHLWRTAQHYQQQR